MKKSSKYRLYHSYPNYLDCRFLVFFKALPVGQEGIKAEEPTTDKIQTAINQKLGIRLPLFLLHLGNHTSGKKNEI
jgi:hypothetical protein